MAGWSLLTDGSGFNCLETLRKLQSIGFHLDLDASLKQCSSEHDGKLRCLFDHILSACLKEVSGKEARPLPVMVGDGSSLDLFKLYVSVKEKGGYDSVTKNRLWSSVTEELGLTSRCGSSVKLIYVKYLNFLEIWLQRFANDAGISGRFSAESGFINNRRSFSVELNPEVEALLRELSKLEKLQKASELDCDGKDVWIRPKENGHTVSKMNFSDRACEYDTCNVKYVDDNDGDEVRASDEPCLKHVDVNSLKRKRESLLRMLNWLKNVAKKPGDPLRGNILEGCREKECEVQECWAQCLAAREALLLRKHSYSSPGVSLLLKRQKIHPSIYESPNGLRCSQRLLSLHSHLDSASTSSSEPLSSPKEESTKRPLRRLDSLGTEIGADFFKYPIQKQVPVGPLFQAHVPDWAGTVDPDSSSFSSGSSDDSKWLGIQFWPLKSTGRNHHLIERDPIGKGRSDSCGCQFPGSTECVRFHVSEKKLRLKLELGSVFYSWRFDQMGEEVSLSWTDQEERRFKAIVRLNPPSIGKSFWDQVYKSFRSKSRNSLVSYYFNVFVLHRRSCQNRITPDSIDSDDDESEVTTVGNSFSSCTKIAAETKPISCVQNKQCEDIDMS